jgi:hypothetical protein
MGTGTMTLDSDGGCLLPAELLQRLGWQPGEKLAVGCVGGVISVGRAEPLISELQTAVASRPDEGESQLGNETDERAPL